ncbi:MAG: sialate O-acetylesterase, partial [Mariniblastus sp.]
MNSKITQLVLSAAFVLLAFSRGSFANEPEPQKPVRVFIFAGQSNMVGSDSKVSDIDRFPPFTGLGAPQPNVRFSYCIGRENKLKSNGWTALSPVNNVVGPELSFARKVANDTGSPIAIIKCAAGGTHLGGDWNPDEPSGFKMYPLALDLVRKSLAELDRRNIKYQLEGFMWHQGENDMFNEQYMTNYGSNLENFIQTWRDELDAPKLKFFVGELCTKTIWGMDLRPRMYAISVGQKSVASKDPHVTYVPTSHVGVEIGGGVGLHYHYGTLGQLEHGINYANAYLDSIVVKPRQRPQLPKLPFTEKSPVKLFVLAGHRNMEGERAFTQNLSTKPKQKKLLNNQKQIPFRYQLGGGYLVSNNWESLGPTGYYDTFGPELSFGDALKKINGNIAIAKFTHSGSQIVDWTPEGSEAKSRNLYPHFIQFIKESVSDLESNGH